MVYKMFEAMERCIAFMQQIGGISSRAGGVDKMY